MYMFFFDNEVYLCVFFFFFQAEDGIRDFHVTGVQTCALPIFNTLSWSAGAELGGGPTPIRFGVRGGQLPFGPGTSAPTEVGVAAGTGRAFSAGRAVLDIGIERLQRKGGGLDERVWTFLVGLTVRP